MGYSVPNTEEKINEALNGIFAGGNQSGMADSMRTLIDAFYEIDNFAFDPNRDKFFHELYNVENQLGLTNGKSEAEMFPQENRNQASFRAEFQDLWNTLSMYHELKQENPEFVENTTLAEFHQNYSDNYTQILLEEEMFDGLKALGRFDRNFGVGPDKHQEALRNLNLIAVEHKANDPFTAFTAEELEKIQKETRTLNEPFNPRGNVKDGLFSGERIKTPAELQNYIDRYETMLRDFMRLGGNNLHLFAQSYEMEGDTTQKLTKHDLDVMTSELKRNEQFLNDDEVFKEYALLEKEKPIFDTVAKETAEATEAFKQISESSKQEFDNDFELKEAQAAYNKELAQCQEERRNYFRLHKAAVNNSANDRERRAGYDVKKKLDEFNVAVNLNTVSFSDNFENDRKRESAAVQYAAAEYKKHIKEHMKDVLAFRYEMNDKVGEFSQRQRELNAMEIAPEYDQAKLDKDVKDQTKNVAKKVETFKTFRENEKKNFNQRTAAALENVHKSYANEKAEKLEKLKEATKNLKEARKVMDDFYKSSLASTANNRKAQKLHTEIKEACDAMTSVKKFRFLGMGLSDSNEYTSMVNAVHEYLNGNLGVKEAHAACETYLAKHSDEQGKLKDMSSELGQLRKQGCVRMMELMHQDPSFPHPIKTTGAKQAEENAKPEEKKKINFDTLKAELAEKSKKLEKPSKKADAKAYSNLNQQIELLNSKKASKKEAPVKS